MNKYILFLGLFFFQIHLLSGNNFINQNRIVKYGIHNGLINNIIFDIDQDKDGYIWFATEEGLSKFNGVDFVNSKWTKAVSSELTSYIAFSVLCEDSILYIGTRSGLVIYNINKDEFKRIVNHSNGPQECNNEIRAIIKKRTGGFWIGTYGGGVFSFDPKTETFNRLNYEYNDKRVLALYEDKNNFLYVGTHFGGMDVIDKKRRLFKRYCQQQRNITDNQVEAIFEDSHGKIWIGTWKGLLMLDKITWNISIFDNEILRKAKINTITQDKSGTIWVGTESFLCNFNPKGYLKQNKTDKVDFIYESESELGLSYKTIRKVFIAKDNNVWIGTYSGGVNFINKLKQKFNYISSKSSAKNTLSDKRVSSISEDKEGNLWVSTDGGGVNFWDKKKQSFTPINSKNTQYNLTDDAILCSFVDSDDEIWLGAYNCILYRKPINSNKFIQYKNEEGNSNSILKSDLTCLYEDSRKNIWIGQRTGLSVFNKSSSQFSIIESLKWYHINHIAEHDGFLIIGTLMGLMKYDYSTNKVEPFRPELKNVFVNTFLFDKNNVLWIGTNGLGLWMYDRKTNKIEIFDEKNGLESNVILSLIELSTGEIWMSTNNSISKISTKTKLIENYNSTDGVQPGMFLRNSALKLSSGLLAFGGTEGMNIFNPKSVKKDTKSTKIVFTGFSLFNQPVNVRTNENTNSPLLRNINSVEEIRLKYSESVFTIDYLGINYSSPERIQYAYILEGSDKSWNYVQNKRSVTYRNLPPGIYIFKVKASSLAGIFDDENIRTLKIIVEPPLWMTWWAYSIYLLLFLLGIYFIGVIVTIKVRASNRIKYERIEREKSEKLYKDKLQFFTNISHELRTPLTLILSPIDKLLSSEKNESNRYLLSLIRKNAVRVISNVNEIIDIRKIDREQMSLRVAEVEIISFFREIVSAFEDVASTKHINLMFHSVEESLIGWISTKFVDKIIYNIISNAFKFTPEYGEIIININGFERNGRMNLSIEISDTGIGIANKDINRIFERFYQIESDNSSIIRQGAGIGLHLVKSLVELHKGDINVQSKVDKGTCVTVVLPISVNAYTKDEVSIIPPLLTSIHKTEIGQGLLKETKLPMSNMSEDLNKKYKILVVEDEADIRNFIALELSDEYDVILAENGKDGLEKALSVIPDLIVSDILMPEMDGIEFCRKIKEDINTSHIPVILLTAKDSHEDRLHGLEVGADSYIPKPFDNRHLHIRIKQLIKSREAVKQKYLQKIEKFSKGYVNKENTLPNIPSRDDILIQKIVSYINENITDPDLKGESIAEYISISRMSLHRKLKALTDLSAGDLIREMRLEFACKLLKETDKTITEISYESGFSSPSYFYTCFVKKYGIAPSEYNKQQDKE